MRDTVSLKYINHTLTMKRINFMLPAQMLDALARYAKTTGLSVSEIIRRAITEFLEK